VDTYNIGDELEGNVTKVVTFGAFVEILDGVEGLVHISELAQHHVENPREIIQPGDPVRVKILEIDSERRRLSLSIKRVEGQVLPVRPIVPPAEGDGTDLDDVPELGLSEDVFMDSAAGVEAPGELAGPDAGAEPTAAAAVDVAEVGGSDRVEPASDQPEAVAAPQAVVEAQAVAEPALAAAPETPAAPAVAAAAPEAPAAPAPEADAPAPVPAVAAAAPEAPAAPAPEADAAPAVPEADAAPAVPEADAAPAPEAPAPAVLEAVSQPAEPATADPAT
jgi:small subunit ribosomal protein S1